MRYPPLLAEPVGGVLLGGAEESAVAEDAGGAEIGEAGLSRAEEFARAAELEIFLRAFNFPKIERSGG